MSGKKKKVMSVTEGKKSCRVLMEQGRQKSNTKKQKLKPILKLFLVKRGHLIFPWEI